jgi:hypothetical protein
MIFGAGAVAAYFFDPEAGPQRRARIVDQARSMSAGMPNGSDGSPRPSDGGAEREPSGSESSRDDAASTGPIDLATGKPLAEAHAAS